MASTGSAGSDINDSRRYRRDLSLSQSHAYYPRYYPDWQFDPYRQGLSEQEERTFKPNVFPVAYDNVGFYTVPPGPNYKDAAVSDESSDDFRSNSTRRRCIVVVCIASVVFLIGISVAIGLYFGVYDRPESSRIIAGDITTTTAHPSSTTEPPSPTSTSPPTIVVSYEASLKLDQTYDPALDNPDSTEYQNLKTEVEAAVNRNLHNSNLDAAFTTAVVTGFRQGSIEALLKLDFSSNTVVIANRVEAIDRSLIETELQQELQRDTTTVDRLNILIDNTVVESLPGTGSADLGQSCSSVLDCSDRFTQCTGSPSVCNCVDGYYDSNGADNLQGTCNQKIAYNSSESTRDVCTEARQCATSGAVCQGGVCLCPTTHFYKNDACHLKISIDSAGCEQTSQCATPRAVCVAGTCSCPVTDFYNGNQCTQKISINGAGCSLNSHCVTPGAVCSSGTCVCSPSSHYYDGQSCLQRKYPGQSCSGSQECTESATCVGSVCQCPNNMYSDGQQCQMKKANGVDCASDIECMVSNAVCDNMSGKCSCTSTMYLDGSLCLNKKSYGAACTAAEECLVTGSACEGGLCVCPATTYLQGTSCINKKAIGESCSVVSECLVTNSICSSGTCQCPAFRYLDGISCLNKKMNGEDCDVDSECLVADSVCNDASGQCECPSTRYLDGMTCINKKGNGESCSLASECLVTDAVCNGGTCGCPLTKYLEGSACLTKKLNGDQCLADMECLVTGAVCDGTTGTCSCPAAMYLNGMTCENKKQDGEICTSSEECLVQDSACNGGRCGCPANMYLQGMACLNKKANGDSCTSTEQCLVSDAMCNGGVCGCPSNMFLQGMACLDKKANGEACSSAMECLVSDSVCNSGMCACPSTMYLQGMACLDKKANGVACTSTMQCLVTDSVCNAGICGCPSDMYLQGMACMNKKSYNEACMDSMECMSPDFVCRSSVCQCTAGQMYDGSVCVMTTPAQTTQEPTTATEKSTKKPTTKPTTMKPTTEEPTTMKPTTQEPTTMKPTTEEPTTMKPTTEEPTTMKPTTQEPTTMKPTTKEPTTMKPTTEEPTTMKPTTQEPTTMKPTTEEPTTMKPTTKEPTTMKPTTEEPTTMKPTTQEPTTMKPTTQEPTTMKPTTEEPTTMKPTTEEPTTMKPTTEEPTTMKPTTEEPTTMKPTTEEPTTMKPTTQEPTTMKPTTQEPTTMKPTTQEPTTMKPTTEEPTTKRSTTGTPTTQKPTTEEPTTMKPTTEEPTTMKPTTEEPTTMKPTTEEPTTMKPTTQEPTTMKATTQEPTTMKPTTQEPTTKRSTTGTPTTQKPTTEEPTTMKPTTEKPTTAEPTTEKTTTMMPTTMTTTSTIPPPTTVPDEIPTVVLNGTMTSNTPYDPQLADPASEVFQNYSMEFKMAIEDGLRQEGQEGEVTNITFREGSIITSYMLVLPVVLVEMPETRDDVAALPAKVADIMQPLVDKILTALVNDSEASGFIKDIDVDSAQPIQVIPDPPCKNGITMLDYAEQNVCGEILKYLLDVSIDDTCSTYISLLDCVSLMYMYNSESCQWNSMRANFENKAKMALGMQNKDTDLCISGNYYDFTPMTEMKPSEPCMDVNLMFYTAKYECHIMYNYMMTQQSVTCLDVKLLESCITTRLEAHYESCNVTTSIPQYGLTMVVDHQEDFFPDHETQLQTCEFCAAPNIEEIMRTNCILPLNVMNLASFGGSDCGHLHSMIMCVEAQASLWNDHNCSVDDIINIIKSDFDRFDSIFTQIPLFQGNVVEQCLDQPIQTIGPELSGDLCNNHNYIAYVFIYECTDWVRLAGGQVYDVCSEHLLTSQCVLSHLNDILGLQCTYDGIHRAIWERNYQTNIVDVLQLMSFPGADCYEHYVTRSGQCEVTLMSNLAVAYEGCVLFMEEALERKLMTIPEMACGIYAEATRCALREAVVYTNPLCSLQDIEPAMISGVFRNYPDIMNCPSQGVGPYNREALCQSPDSLGSTYLAFCGEILTKTNSSTPEDQPCIDLHSFSNCTRQLGTHQDFILSLCQKSELADGFRQLDSTLIQYFAVDQQCFDTNPGQCTALVGEEAICLNPRSGDITCMLDNECGELEKCCSRGCNMECSSGLDDINPKNGTCPPPDDLTPCPNNVQDGCYVDDHCDGEAKCCYDGCRQYCREAGGIYTPADCRYPETIQSAILSCSMKLTLSYDSCRSFSSLVDCVQNVLAKNSYNRVECQYENTQEDVSMQVRNLFGMNSYCRVYHAWLSVNGSGCLDSGVLNMESALGQQYINNITTDFDMIFDGEEFEITDVDFIGGDNCKPTMVQAYIYAVTTQTDLLTEISGLITEKSASGDLSHDISLIILIHEHPDFDKCLDPPTTLESVAQCLPDFSDAGYKYDIWRTCKPIQDLTTCTTGKMSSICDLQQLKTSVFMDSREAVLVELTEYGQATYLADAVARYDYQSCEDRGDVYPCWDEVRIDTAIATCGADHDLSGLIVSGDMSDMYGVTPQMCRHIFDLISCATEEIRGLGADCDFGSSYTEELVYKYFRDNVADGQLLPEARAQVMMYCEDYMPVCSAIYISQAEDSQCYLPYFHDRSGLSHLLDDDCNSTEGRAAFSEFVTCLRLAAVTRGENDCTATKIVEIIDSDYQKFNLFTKDADIATCIGDTAANLDTQVLDNNTVCQSSEALSYFARSCGQGVDNCTVAIEDLPGDADLKCNTYFWLVSCVEEMAANMSFSCDGATIASVDLPGTALEISPTTRQQCDSKQQAEEFTPCDYPLIKSKSEFDFCYEVLHESAMFVLTSEETCSLYFDSMYCMQTVLTYSPQITCNPDTLDTTVKDFMLDFLEVEAHTEAQMTCSALPTTSYAEQFSNCTAQTCDEVLEDMGLLLQTAQRCGVNVFTIQRDIRRYTCRDALEKFSCFATYINEGRPALYACSAQDFIEKLVANVEPGQEDDLNFNPYTCFEWTATVTYYGKYCSNGVVPSAFETDFRNNKLPILMDGLDYEYRRSSCNTIEFVVSIFTDLVEEELQRKLDSVLYSNSAFAGETIAISLMVLPLGPNWCQDVEVLKHFAQQCIMDQAYNYQNWQVCRPINDLTHCIIEKLHQAAGYRCDRYSVMEVLFSNNTQRQQLVSRLGRDFSNKTTTRERLWLDVIQRYSPENCLGGGQCDMQKTENFVGSQTNYLRDVIVANETECELACLLDPECTAVSSIKIWVTYRCLLYDSVDPWTLMPNENSNFYGKICRNDADNTTDLCEDDDSKLRMYETCVTKMPPNVGFDLNDSMPNYGMKPENCQYFFYLVSCMTTELQQLGAQCSNVSEYVYEKLRENFDPNSVLPDDYEDIELCAAYQPVCSPQFIVGVKEMCPWVPGNPHQLLDCRQEADQEVAIDFITCVRMFALAKNQTECTAMRLREIIAADEYKLNLTMKSANVDECWPDEKLSSILPTRESVCESGTIVSQVEQYCTIEQIPNTPCPLTTQNIITNGELDLGCMFYYSHLSCIQTVLANMTFTCSVDQLTIAQPLILLGVNYTDQCRAIFNAPEYQGCEVGLLSDIEAQFCMARLSSLLPVFLLSDQDTTCMLYHESLSCFGGYAEQKGLTCSDEQIHDFGLNMLALQPNGVWPTSDCYRPPTIFENCPAVVPQGDLCNSTERLIDIVTGVCTDIIRASEVGDKCSLYQSLLWCATNATLYVGNECSEGQVESALMENNDTISNIIPDFDVNICSVMPMRWFVELQFVNETYYSAMVDQTSLAFRRFTSMKYYNFISDLKDLFNNLEIIDLRSAQGKVALTFHVMSIEDPTDVLYNKLVTDYQRDMENIRIGSVYDDSADAGCNEISVMERIDRCNQIVIGMEEAESSRVRCQLFDNLVSCLKDNITNDEQDCIDAATQKIVGDLNKMVEYDGNFLDQCDDAPFSKCSPEYIEEAIENECSTPYYKMLSSTDQMDRCRHFEGFFGCIKLHALLNGETCPIQDLEAMVKNRTDLGQFSICKGCNFHWPVTSNTATPEGDILIQIYPESGIANITMKAYNFNPDAEWFGIGISYDQQMTGSDIYTAHMNPDGEWIVSDRYADGRYKPQLDAALNGQNNILGFYGSMIGDTAIVYFQRPIGSEETRDISLQYDRYLQFARGRLSNSRDISYHSFRAVSDNQFLFYCDPYSTYELRFPDHREEICHNSYIHHNLFEYTCLSQDLDELSDPDDRCRMVIATRGCLIWYFNYFGLDCDLADVTRVSRRPEVWEGLDVIAGTECEANLADSECMKQVYVEARWRAASCFRYMHTILELTLIKTTDVVNMIMSSNGNTSLKCSLFEESVACFMRTIEELNIEGFGNNSCSAHDYSPAFTAVAHITYETWSLSNWIVNNYPVIPAEVTYNECEALIVDPFLVDDCPSLESVADRVVGLCSSRILREAMSIHDDPCLLEAEFKDCVKRLTLPRNEMCTEDYVWQSIRKYSDFIAEHMGGFIAECQSQRCKSMDFLIREILPHCQNETDLFLMYAWESGCQYFDALVHCASQSVGAQGLYCDHNDMKGVISDYTHAKTDYDWHYDYRCQRRKWRAELQFENETFVLEMERNSSDAYRNFVRKYSNLINAVLSSFGGGQVIALHEGSIVMTLSFWAQENPSYQMYMVLQQQFEGDMANITIGNVFEDDDQNRCWDRVYINTVAAGQCRRELHEVMNATQKCRPADYLFFCIRRVLNMEDIYCDIDTITTILTTDMGIGSRALIHDLDLEICQNLKCSPGYIEKAWYEDCAVQAEKMWRSSNEEACRHYHAFLSCIKYNALINNEECPAARLDEMIQGLEMKPDIDMWCNDFDLIDNEFDITKSEICNSSAIIKGMVEYGCMKFDLNILHNPLDRCRTELSIYGCVHTILHNSSVMCTMDDVAQVLGRDEVRQGLLDNVPSDCDTVLPDSKCTQDFYIYVDARANECLTALFALVPWSMHDDVDTIPSSDPINKNLKCSLYKDTISCYMTKFNVTETCQASEIGLAIQHSMDIYNMVANATSFMPWKGFSLAECDTYCPPRVDDDGLVGLCAPACMNDTDCTTGQLCCFQGCGLICVDPLTSLPKSFPNTDCPSSSQVADRVVAQCADSVLSGVRWFGMEPCETYNYFKDCLNSIKIPDECDANLLSDSLQEHAAYIASVLDGFDPVECRIAFHCRDQDYIRSEILPHCSNETDTFIKFTWVNGCQHFEALESCVIQQMQMRQLNCNHLDIRKVVTDLTHELTDYDWHYDYNCQRRKWLAELHFENETFVPEMESNSSVAYWNFVRKYYNIIYAVLSNYRGGEVIKLYEGSVVMLLGFWAPGYPYHQINMVLEQQSEANLGDITLGRLWEDDDQNRCWDRIYIYTLTASQCGKELHEVRNATQKCGPANDLFLCTLRVLSLEDIHCDIDTITTILTTDMAIGSRALIHDLDLEICQSLKCSPGYIEKAWHEDCAVQADKMWRSSNEEACRHYHAFLGCIKYNALINNEECPAARLDEMIQALNMKPDVDMWCNDFDLIDNAFDITKSEMCNSSSIIRGMVEYGCIKFDLNILHNPLDRCRTELSIYGCVHTILHNSSVMCTMDDVAQVLGRDEVRQGLLDNVPSDCDTVLPDSKCTQDFYIYVDARANECLTALFALVPWSMHDDVDTIPSSDPNNKNLKCSLYEDTISCYMTKINVTETCQASEIGLAIQHSMDIYNIVANATADSFMPWEGFSLAECVAYCPPREDTDGLPGLCAPACMNDTDCTTGQLCCFQGCGLTCVDPLTSLPESFPNTDCPSSSQVADRVVAQCAGSVLSSVRWFGMEPCETYNYFNYCLNSINLPDECDSNHLSHSLQEHTAYIASVLDGFDPVECRIAFYCRDDAYIRSEILPHCSNETDTFLKYTWENGCEYFDEIVTCVAQTMKSEQLYCRPKDIKEIIAGYTREITNYNWIYRDNCERSQWLALLRFENETFVEEMYDNTSSSYKNFVQKYSRLISAVLGQFNGGHIKYIYPGSVVVSLSFWTIQNPEDDIRSLLQRDFAADFAENITLGSVYKDWDVNRCLDNIFVTDVATMQCGDLLEAMETRADNCTTVTDLLNCVRKGLAREDVYCDYVTIVEQLMRSYFGASEKSLLPEEFDLEYCQSLKCSVWGIEKAKFENCSKPYEKINSTDGETCRNYQEFLGCVKYQALINSEECPVSYLDGLVREMSMNDLEMCDSYEEFEAMFPDTKADVCNSSSVVSHLLEYQCIDIDLNILKDPLDRCRFELSLQGCVHETIGRDASCSMADVERIMRRDEVRDGLLDSVSPDYCDANLPDSQCERDFYTIISTEGEKCNEYLGSLFYLGGFFYTNVNDLSSASGGKLKCSLYVEALRCFMAIDTLIENCSPLDVAPALTQGMRIYAEIVPVEASPEMGENFISPNISFSDCEAEVPEELPSQTCPPSSVLVDNIVARCSASVLYATRYYQAPPCMAYPEFSRCIDEILLAEHESCGFDMSTIEEYESYIFEAIGLSLSNCKYAANCSAVLSETPEGEAQRIDAKCFASLYYLIFVPLGNLSQYELCTTYQTFLSEAETCLLDNLPSYCEGSVDGILQQGVSYLTSFGFNLTSCSDFPADECSPFVLGIQGLLKCSSVFADNSTDASSQPHCRYRSCFRAQADPDCGYTETELDEFASAFFQRLTSYPLPKCTGVDADCSALLSQPDMYSNQTVEAKCFSSFYTSFYMGLGNITQGEICLILSTSLPDVERCLRSSLPNDCSSSVKGLINERLYYLSLKGIDIDSCEDGSDGNNCSALLSAPILIASNGQPQSVDEKCFGLLHNLLYGNPTQNFTCLILRSVVSTIYNCLSTSLPGNCSAGSIVDNIIIEKMTYIVEQQGFTLDLCEDNEPVDQCSIDALGIRGFMKCYLLTDTFYVGDQDHLPPNCRYRSCFHTVVPEDCGFTKTDIEMFAGSTFQNLTGSQLPECPDGSDGNNCSSVLKALILMSNNGYPQSVDEKCFGPLHNIFYGNPTRNFTQKDTCLILASAVSTIYNCLSTSLPGNCSASSIVDNFIIEKMTYIVEQQGFTLDLCEDTPVEPCSVPVFGVRSHMQCYQQFVDAFSVRSDSSLPPNCLYRSCFKTVVSEDCGFTKTDIEMFAGSTFQNLTGSQLPECPDGSDGNNCSSVLRALILMSNSGYPQSVDEKCFGPLHNIFYGNPTRNFTQGDTCLILASAVSTIDNCLSTSLPGNCSASSIVDNFIIEKMTYIVEQQGFTLDSCEDTPVEPCSVSVFGVRSHMQCYQQFVDAFSVRSDSSLPPNCLYRSCFRTTIPNNCNISEADIEIYAGSIFKNYTGYPLPECPASFDVNCSALVYGQPLNGNTTVMPGNNQTLDEKCFNSFMDLVTLTNIIDMTHTEKCSVLGTLWMEAENCLSSGLPDSCQDSLSVLVQEKMYRLSSWNSDVAQFSDCEETDVELCSHFDVLGLGKCFNKVFGYGSDRPDVNLPFQCRLLGCFHAVAPVQCNFTDQMISSSANSAYQRLMGETEQLPECTDIDRCTAKVSRSIYDCARPFYEVSRLEADKGYYPNSSFEYGIQEGCGIVKMASICLRDQFPADDEHCRSLSWDINEEIYGGDNPGWQFNFTISQCPAEETIDECQSLELYIMLQCQSHLSYSCNFHRCVADNLAMFDHCNTSGVNGTASALYKQFTGSELPVCYGLSSPCGFNDCSDVRYSTCRNNSCKCINMFKVEDLPTENFPLCVRDYDQN